MAISRFELTTKILFGAGSISQLEEEAEKLGTIALIVTYPDIRRIGLLDRTVKSLKDRGLSVLTFEKVEPNPRSSTVDEGAGIARSEKVDLVIGLGGGSAMDAAKSIAAASGGSEPIWHYVETRAQPEGSVPAIIQVPTMAGTGSEINNGAVITNWETHIKSTVGNRYMQARVAIIDPEITLTVPRNQTAAGGIDIFTHIVEAYVTDGMPTPLTDGIRETVMKMVVASLSQALAHPDDIEARTQLSWASTIAMSQFARLGGGGGSLTCHGIEHALSGYYDVTHGDGLAALLPAWMKYTLPVMEARFESLGKNVFGKVDGIQATEEWLESVGMRLRLGDLGCELERAEEIADLAVRSSPWLRMHPVPLDVPAIARIYRDSFQSVPAIGPGREE
jgi:alcohol dehydrogenase YqhD (iron-dependent ADH family)